MRVVVGLSGGVDSSVAALQLQREGHEVIGIFMRNWVDDSVTLDNACPWVDDANDALLWRTTFGHPFSSHRPCPNAYRERIVDHMFAEYAAGRTPNPDVLVQPRNQIRPLSKCRPPTGCRCCGHWPLLPGPRHQRDSTNCWQEETPTRTRATFCVKSPETTFRRAVPHW